MPRAANSIRLQVNFTGTVQGVGFRVTADHFARRYPVTGFVRNVADGTVQIEVQGDPSAVDAFLNDIRAEFGSGISNEEVRTVTVVAGEGEFAIRY
ncbi:MAG: acylphosphatase [Phycisphaerae bacterium]|nr:acylphosphatase [Phycisphaerae bacterium]